MQDQRDRTIRDEIAQLVLLTLAECAGREADDANAQLAAALLLATWSVALIQAHRCFGQTREREAAQTVFLTLLDQGALGQKAAMAGTPYA